MREYTYAARAIGTDISASFVVNDEAAALVAWKRVVDSIATYESIFSRFNPHSELTYLNTEHQLCVSPLFRSVLIRALELYYETGGAFNPLLQVSRQGYTEPFETLSGIQPTDHTRYNTDISQVTIDHATNTITLAEGQRLDFGGMLKGYLAELLARELAHDMKDCAGLIVNIGGDLHTRGVDENGNVFVFEIENPVTQEIHTIPITNQSLATSGTYKRRWETTNGEVHHILSPDGHPANSRFVSASVIMKDGALAEGYAKLLLVHGPDHLATLTLPHACTYLLIDADGKTLTNTYTP